MPDLHGLDKPFKGRLFKLEGAHKGALIEGGVFVLQTFVRHPPQDEYLNTSQPAEENRLSAALDVKGGRNRRPDFYICA